MALPTPPRTPQTPSKDAPDPSQEFFLREVDEALREQEMTDAVLRYGKPVGLAVAAGLLALAGYMWWDNASKEAAAKRSEVAIIALDKLAGSGSDPVAIDKELAPLTKEGSAASKANAAMIRAAIAQQTGKSEQAAKEFAAIAADASTPQPMRDMALIRANAITFDSKNPQQVIDALKPLAVPGNPWFGSAAELVGLAYLKQGKPQLAGPLFAAAAGDKTVPESLRTRLRSLGGQLGYDAAGDPLPATSASASAAPAPAR